MVLNVNTSESISTFYKSNQNLGEFVSFGIKLCPKVELFFFSDAVGVAFRFQD